MHRRNFIAHGGGALALACGCPQLRAATRASLLDALLKEVENDPAAVEDAWAFRQPRPDPSEVRAVPSGQPSSRTLSRDAIDLIVAFEVTSPQTYNAKYRKPIWPQVHSGVTIGIGYDLLFASRISIDRDWPMLAKSDRETLYPVCGLSGERAREALKQVQAIDIPWEVAMRQFLEFIPYPTRQTELAFENCSDLPDDSFGALVSLVYNRGRLISESPTRIEMHQIRALMLEKKFKAIPERIRAMKRLWSDDPKARGLVRRREAEALLFEQGLHQ